MEKRKAIKLLGGAFLCFIFLAILGCESLVEEAPEVYKKRCAKCHGEPGRWKKTVGPDLAQSEYTLEQFAKQVKNGSKWAGKPPKKEKYKKRKMPPQHGVSKEDVKEIFGYIRKK